jgi:hypothetical protein
VSAPPACTAAPGSGDRNVPEYVLAKVSRWYEDMYGNDEDDE